MMAWFDLADADADVWLLGDVCDWCVVWGLGVTECVIHVLSDRF